MRIPRCERSVAWVLVVGALDLGLEQFIVIPVLPAVQQAYSASLAAATWLVTGFLLAAAWCKEWAPLWDLWRSGWHVIELVRSGRPY